MNCRLRLVRYNPCKAISHDEEHFTSSGREGIPALSALSRDGLVVDELDAIPSVNERIDIRVAGMVLKVCDSKKNGAVCMDDVWAAFYIQRGKILEWFKLFS